MSASDIDGHGDDDEDDGKDGEHENHSLQGLFCENVLQILDRTPPKRKSRRGPDEFML